MRIYKTVSRFLFEIPNSYVLFPSRQVRDSFVNDTARHLGACSFDQYITFDLLQSIICRHLATVHNPLLHILTSVERESVISDFLLQKNVQNEIMNLENCKTDFSSHILCADNYSQKLRKLFGQYSVIYSIAFSTKIGPFHNFYQAIRRLARLYRNYLYDRLCIDFNCVAFDLYEQFYPLENIPDIRILLCGSEFFIRAHSLWLEQCQTKLPVVIDDFSKYLEKNDIDSSTYFTQSVKRQSVCLNRYEFATIAEEFNCIFGIMARLLCKGASPHDIALTVCDIDEPICSELQSLSIKYDVEIDMQYFGGKDGAVLARFLRCIEACLETNMHPNALRDLFLFPSVEWCDRQTAIALVAVGMKHACLDDDALSRWKRVLGRKKYNETLKPYFFSLQKAMQTMKYAQSYEQLATSFVYFSQKFIKNHEDGNFGIVSRITSIVQELVVYERYMRTKRDISFKSNKIIWNTFCLIVGNRNSTRHIDINKNGVRVYEFPTSIGVRCQHHFFANIAYDSMRRTATLPVLLNDFADKRLFSNVEREFHKEQDKQQKIFKTAVECAAEHVYITTNKHDFNGSRLVPIEWQFDCFGAKLDDNAVCEPDVFETERIMWRKNICAKNEIAFDSYMTSVQRKGLERQRATIRSSLKTFSNGSLLPASQKIMCKILSETLVSVGSVSMLIADPLYFMLTKLLKVEPLFEDMRADLNIGTEFGSIFHDIAKRIMTIPSHSNDQNSIKNSVLESITAASSHFFVHKTACEVFLSINALNAFEALREKVHEIQKAYNMPDLLVEYTVTDKAYSIFDKITELSNDIDIIFTGRSDLVLYKKTNAHSCFIIDYKMREKSASGSKEKNPFSKFVQVWMYYLLCSRALIDQKTPPPFIMENNTVDDNKTQLNNAFSGGALMYVVPQFFVESEKTDEFDIEFRFPKKDEFVHMYEYEQLVVQSIARIASGMFCINDTHPTRMIMRDEIFKNVEYKFVSRKGCYVYPNGKIEL